MTKPADIDQATWDKAESAFDLMLCNCIEASGTTERLRADSIEPLARAILAERERCAKIADEREAICADAVAKIKAGELYTGLPTAQATEECARLEANHIARLIRGEPGAIRASAIRAGV